MNLENLKTLRDAIEKDNTFNMNTYTHGCGTPACIAGHASHLLGFTEPHETTDAYKSCLATYLDISAAAAEEISVGFSYYDTEQNKEAHSDDDSFQPKKREALAMLDYLKSSGDGNVRWDLAMRSKLGIELYPLGE